MSSVWKWTSAALYTGWGVETETVRSSFWIPFEVRWQGRLRTFPKWLGSQLGCCHCVNTAERSSREYSLDICSGHRTLSHSTILGTNTVKTSNSGRNAGAWSHIFLRNIIATGHTSTSRSLIPKKAGKENTVDWLGKVQLNLPKTTYNFTRYFVLEKPRGTVKISWGNSVCLMLSVPFFDWKVPFLDQFLSIVFAIKHNNPILQNASETHLQTEMYKDSSLIPRPRDALATKRGLQDRVTPVRNSLVRILEEWIAKPAKKLQFASSTTRKGYYWPWTLGCHHQVS